MTLERIEEARELVGHARSSMTLDTYSHVMALDEVPAQELERLVEVGT